MNPISSRTRALCGVVGYRLRRPVVQPLLPRDGTRLRAQHTHTHTHTHIHTTSALGPGQTCQRGISIPAANAVAIRLTDPWRSRCFAPRSEIIRRSQSTHASTNASPSYVNSDGDDPHRYRYELYQYKICPFSNMAKAYLEYQRIPYRSIEVNPLTKTELGFSKDYRKVPIVRIIDTDPLRAAEGAVQQLNGTEEILAHQSPIATLGAAAAAAAAAATAEGPSFAESESSLRWQDFARTRLAPLLYPNLCKSLGDSFRAFGYVHDDNHDGTGSNSFSLAQRLSIQCVGSVAMYFAASKILQKYEIDDDAERALADVLTELEEALVSSRSAFLGGSGTGPELGDLAIYGVFKGLEGLPLFASVFEPETQAETPTSYRYPMLRDWYAAVGAAVEERRLQTPRYGYND